MVRIIRRLGPSLGLLLAIAAWMPAVVSAQTWVHNGADTNWTTPANWDTNVIPINNGTADIIYSSNQSISPTTSTVDTSYDIRTLAFQSGALGYTINQNGGSTLTIESGITDSASTLQTISAPVILGTAISTNQTWTVDSGGTLRITGPITGNSVNFTKAGGGILQLGNAGNSGFGPISITGGTIQATTNNALPNVAYNISAGKLDANGTTNTIASAALTGTGAITTGTSGNLSVTGALTMAGTSNVDVTGGTMSVGSLAGSDTTTLLNVNTGHFTDNSSTALSYGGTITIANGGVFELAGAAGGSLTLNNTANGTSSTGGTVQVDAGKTLIAGADGSLPNAAYTLNGTVNAADHSFTARGIDGTIGAAALTLGKATVTINTTGTNTYAGTVTGSTGSAITKTGTGSQTISGAVTDVANINGNGGTLTVSGNITNPNVTTTVNATGGTVVLSGTNTYTGGTKLNAGGVVSIGSDANIGGANSAITFNGGTLKVTGTSLTSLATTHTINTSNFNGGFDIADPNNTFQVSQSLSGSGSLTKSGSGTLNLTGTNSYTGGTTVNDGTLRGSVTGNGTGSLRGNINTTATTANVEFNQTSNGTYSNVLSGSGNLVKTGAATLIVTGNNTYTGTTTINQGALQVGGTSTTAGTTGQLGSGNIVDNASLIFNRSDDITVANNIGTTGTGTLTKNGAGKVTLTGTNTYAGATTVNAGELDINGSTTSSTITVAAKIDGNTTITGGTLGGTGTVVGNIVNNGTVSPGTTANPLGALNQTTGNYTGNSGSTFVVNVNSTDTPSSGTIGTTNSGLITTGNGTFNSGSKLLVNITGSNFKDGGQYTAIAGGSAGTVDAGATISTNEFFVRASHPITSGNDIVFTLSREFVPFTGATFNQIQIGTYLDTNKSNTNTDFQDVIAALTSITSDAAAREALTKLTGDIHPSMAQFGVNNTQIVVNQVASRLRAAPFAPGGPLAVADNTQPSRSKTTPVAFVGCDDNGMPEFEGGQCCGNPWAVWGIGFGMGGSTKFDGNATSASYGMGGVVAGMERWEDDSHLVGIYGAYVGSHVTAADDQTGTMNGGQIGAYLFADDCFNYYTVMGGFEFDGDRTVRRLNFGEGTDAISDIADANFNDWQAFVYAERGMSFESCHRVFQPFVGLQYIYLRQNGFSETGATNPALELTGSSDTVNSLRSLVGTRMQWASTSHSGRRTLPEIHAIWVHEYLDTNNSITQTMTPIGGTPFITQGLDVGRDWALLGGNFTWEMLNGWSMFVNYDMQTNALTTYHVGSGGLGYRW